MRTIYKYAFGIIDGDQTVVMPDAWRLVHVAMQRDKLCLWADVETSAAPEPQKFQVVGTGHEIPSDGWRCIGSDLHGQFVWHLIHKIKFDV